MGYSSSSSWGCELKYQDFAEWTEQNKSSSSWGCELKWQNNNGKNWQGSHPPREDVSWNYTRTVYDKINMSSSSWGCELKCCICLWAVQNWLVILLVRMWVEMPIHTLKNRKHFVILLVRMWVEILNKQNGWTCNNVILLVRMWVEIV